MSNREISDNELLNLKRPNKIEDLVPKKYDHLYNEKLSIIVKIYLFFEFLFCFKIFLHWYFTNSEDFLRNQHTSPFRDSYDPEWINLSYGIIISNFFAAWVIKKTYIKTNIPVGYIYEKPKYVEQEVTYWTKDAYGNKCIVRFDYENIPNYDIIKTYFFEEHLASYKRKLKCAFIPLFICFISSVWTLFIFIKLRIQLASQKDNEEFLELVITQLISNYLMDFSYLLFFYKMVFSSSSFKNYLCWTFTSLFLLIISFGIIPKLLIKVITHHPETK